MKKKFWQLNPKSMRSFKALTLLGLVEFVRGAVFLAFIPIYVPEQLQATVLLSGAVISVQYGSDTAFKVAGGWLVDYLGVRSTLLISLPVALLGLFFFLWSRSTHFLLTGAALFGLGAAPVWPAVISFLLAEAPQKSEASTMSSVYVAWLTGAGLGFLSVTFGYRLGARLVLVAIITAFGLALLPALALQGNQVTKQTKATAIRAAVQFKKLLKEIWRFRALIPGAFAQTLALSMLVPVLQPFLKERLGLNHTVTGLLVMVAGALAVVFLVPLGRLVDRWGCRVFLVTGFALSGLLLILVSCTTRHLLLFIYAALLGLAYACILPAWNGFLVKLIPPAVRASLYSVMMSTEGLGVAVGPALGGKIYVSCGSVVIFLVTASVLLAMAVFYLLLPLNKKDAAVPE